MYTHVQGKRNPSKTVGVPRGQAAPPEKYRPVVLNTLGPGAVGGAGLAEEEGPAGPELG